MAKVSWGMISRTTMERIITDHRFGVKKETRARLASFYAYLATFAGKNNRERVRAAWPSVKKMAKLFGVSKKTIYAWLRLLRDAGILSRGWVDVPGRSPVKVWQFYDLEETR